MMKINGINAAVVSTITLVFFIGKADGQEDKLKASAPESVTPPAADSARSAAPKKPSVDSNLSEQDLAMIEIARAFAAECTTRLETWVGSNAISEAKLFSFLYYPIADTNPSKFHTDYDAMSDRELQETLEKYLKAAPDITYAVLADINGYVPTHNLKYTKPLTGDPAKDLEGNRAKRIYADKTGLTAARNSEPYLMQPYKRDTGQVMVDLSIPVSVKGRHWGAVRLGYLKSF